MYRPFTLDLEKVKLTSGNPVDDYQRLYFNSLKQGRAQDFAKTIRESNYRSNIVGVFTHPPYLEGVEDTGMGRHKPGNTLECYEYQLPDVVNNGDILQQNVMDDTPFLIKGAIFGGICTEDINREFQNNNIKNVPRTDPTTSKKLVVTKPSGSNTTDKSVYDLDTRTGKISLSNSHMDEDNNVNAGNTLTKNQQFKLTKLNYNLNMDHHLINPNNGILWDKHSGFVFLTGIWRVYQDIMNGLSNLDRTIDNDSILKQNCKDEMDYILNYAFYEPVSWDGKQNRRRKSSTGSVSNEDSTTGTGTTSTDPHYVDLHWNNLAKDLRNLILNDFKQVLRNQYPKHDFNHVELSGHLLQRIRGGYIKIQGTWLPWEVARLVCTRFCFPIRFFLVPLFGPEFPKQCEDYYFNVMQKNLKYLKDNAIAMAKNDLNPQTTTTGTTGTTGTTRRRRNTYAGTTSSNNTPTTARQRKKKTSTISNVSPSLSPRHESSQQQRENEPISPRTKKVSLKPLTLDTKFQPKMVNKPTTTTTSQPIKIIRGRRRANSDVGLLHSHNSNSLLPPITSIFEQINSYDYPMFNNPPRFQRPRLNSLPTIEPSHPTISTLSTLATLYNTGGHRYSYPKVAIQPTTQASDDIVTGRFTGNYSTYGVYNNNNNNNNININRQSFGNTNYQWSSNEVYQPRSQTLYKEQDNQSPIPLTSVPTATTTGITTTSTTRKRKSNKRKVSNITHSMK